MQEPVLTSTQMNHILDYEKASHIVEEAEYIGLGLCYCRHKAEHAGHPCEINAPWDVCLTFGNVARSLTEHGRHARLISKEEAMDALQRSYDANLVQIGENVRENPAFICNCCGCCCEALQAARRFAPVQIITPVNSTHRFVLQAIEKGTLQNLLFDNQAFASHRAMAQIFGSILKLPPVKQALASKQFKSIYLDKLLSSQVNKQRKQKS